MAELSPPKDNQVFRFYYHYLLLGKIVLRSARIIQIASANFHENAMVKVPIAVIPMAGRSQQRSQIRPETIRNEITIYRSMSKINIFSFSFLVYKCFPSLDVCIITYYMKKSTLCSSLSRLLQWRLF